MSLKRVLFVLAILLTCTACSDPLYPNCEDVKKDFVWYDSTGVAVDTTWIITKPCQELDKSR